MIAFTNPMNKIFIDMMRKMDSYTNKTDRYQTDPYELMGGYLEPRVIALENLRPFQIEAYPLMCPAL